MFHVCAFSSGINYTVGAFAECLLSLVRKGKYPINELAEF